MKATLLVLSLLAADGGTPDAGHGHGHCWHVASVQHTAPNHRDDLCCFCGLGRCVGLYADATEGHGPFTQGAFPKATVIP